MFIFPFLPASKLPAWLLRHFLIPNSFYLKNQNNFSILELTPVKFKRHFFLTNNCYFNT